MKKLLFIVPALMALVSCVEPHYYENRSDLRYDKRVEKLEARLVFESRQTIGMTPIIEAHVELKDLSNAESPLYVAYSEHSALDLQMMDKLGRVARNPRPKAVVGNVFLREPQSVLLDPGRSALLRMRTGEPGILRDARAYVSAGPVENRNIDRIDDNEYFLEGTVTFQIKDTPFHNAVTPYDPHYLEGADPGFRVTLDIPPTRIDPLDKYPAVKWRKTK